MNECRKNLNANIFFDLGDGRRGHYCCGFIRLRKGIRCLSLSLLFLSEPLLLLLLLLLLFLLLLPLLLRASLESINQSIKGLQGRGKECRLTVNEKGHDTPRRQRQTRDPWIEDACRSVIHPPKLRPASALSRQRRPPTIDS